MKKSIITGVALGAFALSIGFMAQPANASAAYRTIKTKSYASTTPDYHAKNLTKSTYMWNSTLTKKLHNLKNYPRTTWYLQKSVKLTNGKKTGIFYYLKNKSGSASGYVWRGYLTKGTNGNTDPNPTATAATRASDAKLMTSMKSLFPGTVSSSTLDTYAEEVLDGGVELGKSLTTHIKDDLGVTDVYAIRVKGISKPATLAKVKTQLGKNTVVRKNETGITYNVADYLNDFDGWYIGTSLFTGAMGVYTEIILAK